MKPFAIRINIWKLNIELMVLPLNDKIQKLIDWTPPMTFVNLVTNFTDLVMQLTQIRQFLIHFIVNMEVIGYFDDRIS